MELVSVHIPKTAGSAFRNVLRQVYGPDGLFEDYTDWPLDPKSMFNADPAQWRRQREELLHRLGPRYRAVHGHFAVSKYEGCYPKARRVVWLREPLSWLFSLYYFWQNLPRSDNSFHQKLLDERLSLIEFAELPQAQNRFNRTFLNGKPLEQFDFVGLQEHFSEDYQDLVRLMNWPDIQPEFVNANPEPLYQEQLRRLWSNAALIARLTRLNEEDTDVYRQARRLRERRRSGHR